MQNISVLKQELSNKIITLKNIDNNAQINSIVEEQIMSSIDSEFASLWIYNFPMLVRKRETEKKEISIEEKQGLLYKCYAQKKAVIYNYLSSEKGYISSIDNPDNIKIKSKIMIPLIDNGTFIGIATAYSSVKKIRKFTNDDMKIFQAITPFIIECVYKMKANCNAKSTTNQQDLNNNLDALEETFATVQPDNEMLQYVSNIVHDIRTPANGLLGFLEILQDKIEDERLKEYINHARSSALLINELTTSILDGVSEKREAVLVEPKVVNTIKYFSNIAETFSANMSKKSINYNIFIDPLLPQEIKINSIKTKRVIMNLISNASKFTPENGSIEFSVRYKHKEKKLHIFVKDSGIGIAKDKQEEIFKEFTQAEEDTKNLYGGTGLGLSICAAYVKEMDGKLSIESKLNQGSTFYFDLPMEMNDYASQFKALNDNKIDIAILMDKSNTFVANHIARYLVKIGINVDKIEAITQLNQISSTVTHLITFQEKLSGDLFLHLKKNKIASLIVEENFLSLDTNNLDGSMLISQYTYFGNSLYTFLNENTIPKVLIVEDDHLSSVLVKRILEDEYCEIDIATNGEEGLELLTFALNNNSPYSIVYSDHNMPILSGGEMLQIYKERESLLNPSKKVCSVSISGDRENTIRNNFKYDFYATKPFNREEIISLFRATIK